MPSTIVSIPPQESLFHCGLDEAIQLPVDFQSLPLEAVAGVPVLSDYDRFVVFFSGGKDSMLASCISWSKASPSRRLSSTTIW